MLFKFSVIGLFFVAAAFRCVSDNHMLKAGTNGAKGLLQNARDCCPKPGACESSTSNTVQIGMKRGCVVGPPRNDFETIANLLRDVDGPGFALARYADAERQVAMGGGVQSADGWSFESGNVAPKLRNAVLATLRGHSGEAYYYGFAGMIDPIGTGFFLKHLEQSCEHITFANIFVNAHLNLTTALYHELAQLYANRTVLISSAAAQSNVLSGSVLGNSIIETLPLDPFGVMKYENNSFAAPLIAQARFLASKYNGHLFVVSGGPLAKILISEMWAANCRNRYVDFGSTVDNILAKVKTREYPLEYVDKNFAVLRTDDVTIHSLNDA